MGKITQATRTINPLPFENMESHRFEDLVRQLAYSFRSWKNLEATGRLGSDGGTDIRGTEVTRAFPPTEDDLDVEYEGVRENMHLVEEREWRIQCKRYKEIGPTLLRTIVGEVVPDPSDVPYGIIIAAACDVSSTAIADFHDERVKRGVEEGYLWTRAHLEDLLFRPENDRLLFAYFGISLVTRRRSQIRDIQAELTIKRKVMRAIGAESVTSVKYKEILIRDVLDDRYPNEVVSEFGGLLFPPWHTCTAKWFYVNGLIVNAYRCRGWIKPDKTWDITRELEEPAGLSMDQRPSGFYTDEQRLADEEKRERKDSLYSIVPEDQRALVEICYWLPFSSILEVDPWGDPAFPGPHFFCQFTDEWGPYIDVSYIVYINNEYSLLDKLLRGQLFEPIPDSTLGDQLKKADERSARPTKIDQDTSDSEGSDPMNLAVKPPPVVEKEFAKLGQKLSKAVPKPEEGGKA